MKKILSLAIVFSLFAHSSSASSLRGIYSCSSGMNNDRPITYLFSSKMMIRDNKEDIPYEYMTSLNDGKVLYIGKQLIDGAQQTLQLYGAIDDDSLRYWAENALGNGSGVGSPAPKTREEFALLWALNCKLNTSVVAGRKLAEFMTGKKTTADRSLGFLKTEKIDAPINCVDALYFAKTQNIENIVDYFVKQNKARALPHLTKTVVVTIDTKNAVVFESTLDRLITTSRYNCTVMDVEVPPIGPPATAVQKPSA